MGDVVLADRELAGQILVRFTHAPRIVKHDGGLVTVKGSRIHLTGLFPVEAQPVQAVSCEHRRLTRTFSGLDVASLEAPESIRADPSVQRAFTELLPVDQVRTVLRSLMSEMSDRSSDDLLRAFWV